jgi:hypothetical protein
VVLTSDNPTYLPTPQTTTREQPFHTKHLPASYIDRPYNTLPPTQVFSDNQGALVTVKSGALKAGSKHVNVEFYRSRDLRENGVVNFGYVDTKDNLADLLTQPLPAPAHQRLTSMIGLTSHRCVLSLLQIMELFLTGVFPLLHLCDQMGPKRDEI